MIEALIRLIMISCTRLLLQIIYWNRINWRCCWCCCWESWSCTKGGAVVVSPGGSRVAVKKGELLWVLAGVLWLYWRKCCCWESYWESCWESWQEFCGYTEGPGRSAVAVLYYRQSW
jgi:hypothetical protein